jgi:TorA maturation chaperone TorD
MIASTEGIDHGLAAEDGARADLYGLLSALWAAPPGAKLLDAIATADDLGAHSDGDPPLARQWRQLRAVAAAADPGAVREEYRDLFTAAGEPPVVLNASWHRTGFLNEYPLAEVRADLARASLSRLQSSYETEDHIAALLEAMRVLIGGESAHQAQSFELQRGFFTRHIKPWYADLARRVENTGRANFYRAVVALTREFLDTESAQFENY